MLHQKVGGSIPSQCGYLGFKPIKAASPHGISGDLLMDLDPDVGRETGPLWKGNCMGPALVKQVCSRTTGALAIGSMILINGVRREIHYKKPLEILGDLWPQVASG
jgi:hypothetical protein